MLTEDESRVLHMSAPLPGMLLEHIFYDFDDRPLSWGWFVCRSSRLRLHTQVGIEQVNGMRDERIR
jgi:GntR family transcriptional regulator